MYREAVWFNDLQNVRQSLLTGVVLRGAALMRLLGHHNANMTLIYTEVTQEDLHNEYEAALAHPRYLVPRPVVPVAADTPTGLEDVLAAAIRLIEGRIASEEGSKQLVLLRRRLVRISSFLKKLGPGRGEQK